MDTIRLMKRGGKISDCKCEKKRFGGEIEKGKSGIRIKPENKGKFTKYCNGKVTEECIRRGKNSSNPVIRKRATFAANARSWSK